MLQDQNSTSLPSYCIVYCDQECIERTMTYEYQISMIFSIGAILVSAYNIFMHLRNFNNSYFQSKIIIILIMAPFYCFTSMASFIFPQFQIFFTLTRDSYEGLLLFTFFYLMVSYLAYDKQTKQMDDKQLYTIMVASQHEVHHFWPFGYCQKPYQLTDWRKAKYFTYRCKKWVLQFLVVKFFATLLMYFIYPQEEGTTNQNFVEQLVVNILSWIVGISASYSLYYLVLFYHALSKPLAPYSALLKFLTIKITIFFTFWQKIMINIFQIQFLSCFNTAAISYHKTEILSSVQNTLICFQMFLMAIASGFAYTYHHYVSSEGPKKGNFVMVVQDTVESFKEDFRLIKPKRFGFDADATNIDTLQLQLQQIKASSRNSAACSIEIRQRIDKIIMEEDYLQHF